jgi:hypothetical protein
VNWRIRRIRLEAAGPADACYDDVTLSFMANGRAAPNAVVLLRNGGGKSLLLYLIFRALLPRKSDGTKTAADQRDARPVVTAGDCATVAIEWSHQDDDRLLITGHSFERDGTEARWIFEPREGSMTLDDLPLRDVKRRRTRAGLVTAMTDRGNADSRLRFRTVEGVGPWERELMGLGIDPEILRSQARLNRREGGDDRQLRFRDAAEFVRLVLQMVLDDEVLGRLQRQVADHAAELAERDAKAVEAEFCRDVSALLGRLADAQAALVDRKRRRRCPQREHRTARRHPGAAPAAGRTPQSAEHPQPRHRPRVPDPQRALDQAAVGCPGGPGRRGAGRGRRCQGRARGMAARANAG